MYGLFTYIYQKNELYVGKFTSLMDGMDEFDLSFLSRFVKKSHSWQVLSRG